MIRLLTLLISFSGLCLGAEPLLRLSKVADAPGKGISEHDFIRLDEEGNELREKILLFDEFVLTEKDVARASIDPFHDSRVHIELNEAGAAKMREATAKMQLGKDRIAVLIEGKIKIAPTVQAVLSRRFEISGLGDLEIEEIRRITDWLNRANGELVDPQLMKDRHENPERYFHFNTYSKDEFAHLHQNLKKIGIHTPLEVFDEDSFNATFKKGTSKEKVRKRLGLPSESANDGTSERWVYHYHPDNPALEKLEFTADHISFRFDGDVVARAEIAWTVKRKNHSKMFIEKPGSRKLRYSYPAVPDGEFSTWGKITPAIKIDNPDQPPSTTDLSDLLDLVEGISVTRNESAPDKIPASCDVIQYLADYLPELKPYKNSKEMLDPAKIEELVEPYLKRKKPFPSIK